MKNRVMAAVCCAILLLGTWIGASEAAVEDIGSGIVRLHILANSDSEEDQALKLAVRDRVIAEVRARENAHEITKEYLQKNENMLLDACRDEICKQGYSYNVRMEFGRFYFPTKTYENITLPAGDYDAVRILIGEGAGQNWWCVMYPPLCFTSETKGEMPQEEMEKLRQSMSNENFDLIQNEEQIVIKPSLKIVELWQELKHRLQK